MSRAGSTSSSAQAEEDDRMVQIVSMVRTSENKIYRQGIADPKELAERLSFSRGGSFRLPGIDHRIGGSGLFHSRPAGIDSRVRRSPRRRPAAAGRSVLARRWRLERLEPHRPVSHDAAHASRHVSSRGRSEERHHAYDRRTGARRRRQHHYAPGGRSRRQRRQVEEAALPDGL